MQYASFGSISTGTLLTEDLLSAFSSELEYQVQRNAQAWCSDSGRQQRDSYMALVGEYQDMPESDSPDYDEDSAYELLQELQTALEDFAPPYAYFGTHSGDGADFGYWLSESAFEDFDGLRVNDTSEVPDDYCGEVMHVNDHGNATLYVADKGALSEVWAVV